MLTNRGQSVPIIIRQDIMPAQSSVAGIKKPSHHCTSTTVFHEQTHKVQWPPRQPTMGVRRQYKQSPPAAAMVVKRQDMLPARSSVAGIRKPLHFFVPPAEKTVCEDHQMQWPPERPGMQLRHVVAASVDDRRISWILGTDDNDTRALPTPIVTRKLRRPSLTKQTTSKTKSLPIMLCKPWKRASFHTAKVA
jgi:hypothetical protein